MKDDVASIIDYLDTSSVTQTTYGLHILDHLLFRLIAEIETQSESHPSELLQEFIDTQDNVAFNLVSYLVDAYRYDLPEKEQLLLNRSIQGCLLIHPASRLVFNRAKNMKRLLHVLSDSPKTSITVAVISTLIHVLLKCPTNYRVFEACGGCSIVIRHLRLNSADEISQPAATATTSVSGQIARTSTSSAFDQQTLNFKIIEFLMLYLSEEEEQEEQEGEGEGFDHYKQRKTVQEKAKLFEKEFPEIDLLIENLNSLGSLQ
ncbi:hypothetical protein PVL30_000960 [Lodderomyces elongisporus]|uniref:uncharacterized protein n=1 Tax=Lodderomyces elongisporus TaxID=36914 RepID=UPI002920D591|nr:uncharacterized protein PVL30_000960 [Lodderomyces elongisporus]WLF77249.1 hypothetical protein PVL30_000960 [Lodderomyces elongisporus]